MSKDQRRQNVEIFGETLKKARTIQTIPIAVQNTAKDRELARKTYLKQGSKDQATIQVTEENCITALQRVAKQYPPGKVAILNMASFMHPGGGVVRGANAQEEFLCRISNLYTPLVDARKAGLYPLKDGLIVKNVTFFRDEEYDWLRPNDWVVADVITISAFKFKFGQKITREQEKQQFLRVQQLLDMCLGYDAIVLSAFGCGAYHNSPAIISQFFKDLLLTHGYRYAFKKIVFAILNDENSNGNFETFYYAFKHVISDDSDDEAAAEPEPQETDEPQETGTSWADIVKKS